MSTMIYSKKNIPGVAAISTKILVKLLKGLYKFVASMRPTIFLEKIDSGVVRCNSIIKDKTRCKSRRFYQFTLAEKSI